MELGWWAPCPSKGILLNVAPTAGKIKTSEICFSLPEDSLEIVKYIQRAAVNVRARLFSALGNDKYLTPHAQAQQRTSGFPPPSIPIQWR